MGGRNLFLDVFGLYLYIRTEHYTPLNEGSEF
jgi:hypothetical protein